MDWVSKDRIPMDKGAAIVLGDCVIVNDDEPQDVSMGSTCMVYHGHIEKGAGVIKDTPVIIKEFYPQARMTVFDISREFDEKGRKSKLVIGKMTQGKEEYKNKFFQFMQGIEAQKVLSKSSAMEVAVKPWFEGRWGDSYYLVCDIHNGCDLKKKVPERLSDKISAAVCIAESMEILHEAGYVMPDFKPENLMYIEKPQMVRILDVDSIVEYTSGEIDDKLLFGNIQYASPEVKMLFAKYTDTVPDREMERMWRRLLQPISDVYSMGTYFSKLFFGSEVTGISSEEEIRAVIEEFVIRYRNEVDISDRRLREIGVCLADIVSKSTIYNRVKRKKAGYANAADLMKDLNKVYFMLTSEEFVPRKEIAKANATFAAYNMLQKYPLFDYRVIDKNGQKQLKVILKGEHAMREGMLAALMSVGQMLDTKLSIAIVANDAEEFWNYFISKEKNPVLKDAVVWYTNGQMTSGDVDQNLVARPLADIYLFSDDKTDTMRMLTLEEEYRYLIFLEEDYEENPFDKELVTELSEGSFVGYLSSQGDIQDGEMAADLFGISVDSFSETYNERMFKEQIYKMGLMAHAYYCGYMQEDAEVDMKELEKEFRQNIYNIESSERCALHSIYKMSSLGLDRNRPGRFFQFYKKIQNPEILEELAWLEHLSWSAYMLTSGAIPVSMDEFESYAYKNNNDWKDSTDKAHIRHPLLVSSTIGEEEDMLDIVSRKINCWWSEHGMESGKEFKQHDRELVFAAVDMIV